MYQYDALDRIISKTYTDPSGNDSTLGVTYQYDTAQQSGSQNDIGRLTVVATQNPAITNDIVTRVYPYRYDGMGRILGVQLVQLQDPLHWFPGHNLNYTYDLAGHLTSITNGFGSSADPANPGLTVNYQYDAAGRPTNVSTTTSAWQTNDSNHPPTLLNATSFDAVGLTGAGLGISTSGTTLGTLSRSHDRRARLTGETDSFNGSQVYQYLMPNNGFYPNGNLRAVTDSVMGAWTFGEDGTNRLIDATITSGTYKNQFMCWKYDAFGNRLSESLSSTACNASPSLSSWATYNSNNQVTSSSNDGSYGSGYVYDADGDVIDDGVNQYLYDAENRVCAVYANYGTPVSSLIGYIYDGLGHRVAQGTLQTFSCNITGSGNTNFSFTKGFLVGPDGKTISEVSAGATSETWIYSNVFLGDQIVATYNGGDTYFTFNDWLGSKRAVASAGGCLSTYLSLPFGNYGENQQATGNCSDAAQNHFTGKERDSESGLDYFGARYYSSSMGRWMSPDWAYDPEPVPYARLSNPQTLNLYNYVENNPLRSRDEDGHTHQECDPDTWNDKTNTITAGACHDVPDWWNFGTRFMNWRQKQTDAWNARIAAHAPPTPPKSNGLSAEDIAQAMMGVVGATRIRVRGPSSPNILSRDATGKIHGDIPDHVPDDWTQEQLETAKGELEESIQQRANEQTQYGEDGPHRARMQQEENLLKQVNSKLNGK